MSDNGSWRFSVVGNSQIPNFWNEISCDTESGCPELGNWAHRCSSTNANPVYESYNPHIECITPPIYDYQGYFKIHNGFELAAEVTWAEKFHSSLDYCFNWCKTKMKCAIVKYSAGKCYIPKGTAILTRTNKFLDQGSTDRITGL